MIRLPGEMRCGCRWGCGSSSLASPGQTSPLRGEGALEVPPLGGCHRVPGRAAAGGGPAAFPGTSSASPVLLLPASCSNQFSPRASAGFVLPLEDPAGLRLPREVPASAALPEGCRAPEHPGLPHPGSLRGPPWLRRGRRGADELGGGDTGCFPLVPSPACAEVLALGWV